MSMRTEKRKQAHLKAEMLGIKKPNKQRYFQGKPMGSWFSLNWQRIGSTDLPKPKRSKV